YFQIRLNGSKRRAPDQRFLRIPFGYSTMTPIFSTSLKRIKRYHHKYPCLVLDENLIYRLLGAENSNFAHFQPNVPRDQFRIHPKKVEAQGLSSMASISVESCFSWYSL